MPDWRIAGEMSLDFAHKIKNRNIFILRIASVYGLWYNGGQYFIILLYRI